MDTQMDRFNGQIDPTSQREKDKKMAKKLIDKWAKELKVTLKNSISKWPREMWKYAQPLQESGN